jgi:hypothetical protein
VIFLLLSALVLGRVPVVVQLDLGLVSVQNRYRAVLTGVHSFLQPCLYSSNLAVLLAQAVAQ